MGSSYKYLRGSDGTGNAVLAHITSPRSIGATTLIVDSLSKWSPFYIVTTGTLDVNGYMTPSSMTEMYAHTNAGQIIIDGFVPGYTDNGNTATQVAIIKPTNHFANSLVDQALVSQNDDGTLKSTALDAFYKPSEISGSFISSGGIVALSSGLIATVSDIVAYYNGLRFTKTGIANQTFAINKDTYVDFTPSTGAITLVPVANGATTGMTLTANSIRIAKVITNGTTITSVTQIGLDPLLNVIYPNGAVSIGNVNLNSFDKIRLVQSTGITVTNTGVQINFNTVSFQQGSRLTVSGSNVLIGAGVSKVRVTTNLMADTAAGGAVYLFSRIRNGAAELLQQLTPLGTTAFAANSMSDIIPVKQGDLINVYCDCGAGTLSMPTSRLSSLLVEVVG